MCLVGDETQLLPWQQRPRCFSTGSRARQANHDTQQIACCPSLAVSCPTKSAGNTITALLTPSRHQEPPGTAPTGARLVRRLLQRLRPHQVGRIAPSSPGTGTSNSLTCRQPREGVGGRVDSSWTVRSRAVTMQSACNPAGPLKTDGHAEHRLPRYESSNGHACETNRQRSRAKAACGQCVFDL